MKLVHVLCAIEAFVISRAGHGTYGDEMRLEGWYLSHAKIVSMALVFGRETEVAFEVHNRSRESEGVFRHHGASFGEAARRARFLLVEKMPIEPLDFETARLRVVTEDGTILLYNLDAPSGLAAMEDGRAADRDLVMRFESCGDNCEFGLLQRKIGTERMSLLRYSGVADIFALARLIRSGFAGFAEGNDLAISIFGPEWIANVGSGKINFHTGRIIADITEDRIREEERRKLQFLSQKFVDDLEEANKTLVYRTLRDKRGGPDGKLGMDELYDALRTHGAVRLLWVNEADDTHPHGTVLHVRGGLYHGFISRLAPHHDAFDTRVEAWVEVLTEYERLRDLAD